MEGNGNGNCIKVQKAACAERMTQVEGCGRSFSKETSTTTLASHLTSKHRLTKGDVVPGQVDQLTSSKNGGRLIAHNRLDDDKRARLLSKLVNWIMHNKQLIAVVENNFFKEFIHELNPFFNVQSRRTIGRGVDDAYEEAKAKIALVLESIPGDVALTCDGWSSRIMKGYFVVTLHWVDENWNLRSTVIEFIYFPPPHNQSSYLRVSQDALPIDDIRHTRSGFTVPAAKRDAEAMLSKMEKYKENMNSPLCLLASSLDPSMPLHDEDIQELKFQIRQILIVRCGYQQQQNVEILQRLGLLAAAKLARAGSCAERGQIDEVENFFELTKRTDTSCDNILEWWSASSKRFPLLSRLARDTFMVMGSSVPSESAFSDSSSFVTPRRSSLSDENISKMMKLRSWNRLLKVLNK
ncbi:hypothetical protein AXG93_3960s1180 [Marchantia polymorpha subsp. ruderalis]|uniref:HAT C-terminal dimerisation domain-containing protein n=1 Tax=Marchantia polymorpha subsp. ruderalis TaxID=1480154 RepID=A0A176VGZ3_MARPO|nr:hypothetical protein AXG93_3960s1180 [Marchantia polymorpha subsp. ruderalis]